MKKLDSNQRNPDGSFKPMVVGVNACACAQCGRVARTNRPRVGYLCPVCFIEKEIGRKLTRDDIKIVRR